MERFREKVTTIEESKDEESKDVDSLKMNLLFALNVWDDP